MASDGTRDNPENGRGNSPGIGVNGRVIRARPGGPSPAPGSPATAAMADLLTEAASDVPGFAAVICENIERSGRDTFNALKLEKKLSRTGSRYSPPTSPPSSTG